MINLVEILKNAPKGLELYSPVYGKVKLETVNEKIHKIYKIAVTVIDDKMGWGTLWFDECGRVDPDSECCLFPSKENRDWNNWQKTLIKVGHFIAFDSVYGTSVAKVKNIATWGKRIRFATTEEIEQWCRDMAILKEEPAFKISDLKPFNKVLGFNSCGWGIDLFSDYAENNTFPYICLTECYKKCVPYNDETKHLLGTTEEYNGKYKTW